MAFMIGLLLVLLLVMGLAPSPTVRGTPAGEKLKDGYRCLITFARLPTASFWEKSLKPPGFNGGEAIDQTTMHNEDWITKSPQALMEMTNITVKVAYDPRFFGAAQVQALINIPDTLTVRFGDGSTMAFYGYLMDWEPDELQRGTQPEGTLTIVPTNYDDANNVEAGPVITEVSGT